MTKWISVEDRLPDDKQHVLFFEPHCLSHAERGIGSGIYFSKYFDCRKLDGSRWITHWMPLPDPPEQDNER